MLTDAQYYVRHLMPVQQLWRMIQGGGAHGDSIVRKLALSAGRHWWHDTQHSVCDFASFVKALQSEWTPQQLHLDTLEIQDAPRLVRCERELVFDMDLTDTRFKRFCRCESGDVCRQCWMIIEGAALLLEQLLTVELGLDPAHLLWVWSGRKGVHCVVNDRWAMQMSNEERERLAQWLERPATSQEWLERLETLDPTFVSQLEKLCNSRVDRHQMWQNSAFKEWALGEVNAALPSQRFSSWQPGSRATAFLALQLYWPAVDLGPLRHNHLYKAPFSVHAESQRISLPLSVQALQDDDLAFPCHPLTLRALCEMHRQDGALPDCFVQGCELLSRWTALYSL